MVKVNHFNTYPYGGAATAAMRIHRGLVSQGVDSNFLYRIDEQANSGVENSRRVELNSTTELNRAKWLAPFQKRAEKKRRREIHRLFDKHLAKRGQGEHEVFSMARLPDRTFLNWQNDASDIVHLHWMAHMIDFPSFFDSIPDQVPIVWTLHDMGVFTGGCHYAGDCTRFRTGCGNCPQVVEPKVNDVSVDSIRAKRKSLRRKKLHIVAPSRWLIDLAKASPIFPGQTEFSVIHYGLDLNVFRPLPQSKSRHELGVEANRVIVGFGADDLSNHRKGFTQLCQALRVLAADSPAPHPEIELAVFGKGEIPADLANQFHVRSFGFVKEPAELAKIYSVCDLIVVPSLEDNQPQIGLEAMACGRPVVGFDAGGIPEYVEEGKTGVLVAAKDNVALARAVGGMVGDPELRRTMGENGRRKVEAEFEMEQQTREYIRLYHHLQSGAVERRQVA